ncbi:uncharacterized protein [Drosophila kikkawai]|uniref:MADF domain-containing protein n=1 Tax=Drosophila kikkawai TaxID=30033 RepID=A0A6P4IF47_DROKI|nr:uncharacterized protein LOC108073895 [Drosophila kikkawai]
MNSRDRKFWTEFLLLYRSLPAVWQIQNPDYGCRELKTAGYEQLVRKLREVEPDANRTTVVRKINSFRTNFRRDLRRRDQCSAMGEHFTSTLWYFDILSFLEDQDTGARSHRLKEQRCKGSRFSSKEEDGDELTQSPQKVIKEEFILSPVSCRSPTQSVALENNLALSSFSEIPEGKSSSFPRLSETEALSQAWGHQFEELSHGQRTIARKLISDILYYGCMEQLDPVLVGQMHQLINKAKG